MDLDNNRSSSRGVKIAGLAWPGLACHGVVELLNGWNA